MMNWQSSSSSQNHINIQVFKYRFSIIITATLFCLLISSSNASGTSVLSDDNDNVQRQTANDCREYFQRQIVNDDDHGKWSGLIEFGVSRKQMWGFDITVVFLFDDKTFKVYYYYYCLLKLNLRKNANNV